jgi:SulP family sulfate permease
VVAQQTFAWGSLRVLGKVPRNDALVIVAVTIITVFTDLAIAVLCGIVIAALSFAWQHAREIHAHVEDHTGDKIYLPRGTLFFASTTRFHELFDPAGDPGHVTIDCSQLLLADHSALAALQGLYERYRKAGKQPRMKNLSARNRHLLSRAGIEFA